jgi:hypothetical protein
MLMLSEQLPDFHGRTKQVGQVLDLDPTRQSGCL